MLPKETVIACPAVVIQCVTGMYMWITSTTGIMSENSIFTRDAIIDSRDPGQTLQSKIDWVL